MSLSIAQQVNELSDADREFIFAGFGEKEFRELDWSWQFWGRPEQRTPPGDWRVWLLLVSRGWGKTRTGAEFIRDEVLAGRMQRIALVAETQRDLEDVMVFGRSGIASVFPPEMTPKITRKPVRIEFHNGAVALGYNATEPDQLRGPEFDGAWCDELAKWRYAQEAWDQLQFGLRIGKRPRIIVTTTPRPIPLIRHLLGRTADDVHLTRGRLEDNIANLAPQFVSRIRKKYAGTRLGRQELEAEVLDDVPGALWQLASFETEKFRMESMPELMRVVVAVDPSGARDIADEAADTIGIVVAGKGFDGRGYVLADRSCRLSPDGWGRRAIEAYREFKADRLIAERNFGGAMVDYVIHSIDANVSYREVTASRGKAVRAEPIAALYEQGRISHVGSAEQFDLLESQMLEMASDGFRGDGSPDRVDALVWALTELMLDESGADAWIAYYGGLVEQAEKPAVKKEEEKEKEQPAPADNSIAAVYYRITGAAASKKKLCDWCGEELGSSVTSDGEEQFHADCYHAAMKAGTKVG